jgi:REP element-mobilizing transposase RayT
MSQSLSNLIVHLVFSAKHRKPFLRDESLRDEMHRQLGGTSKTLECPPVVVGGVEDHVHILARQARTITVADWVKELKRVTSLWIKERDTKLRDFQWQAGYGAFSVSQSNADEVVTYIKDQKEHHKHFDFQTEYRELLERHGIEYDERYVWE